MSGITKELYEQQAAACDNKCAIEVTDDQKKSGEMPCVRCPFCLEIVTALLTGSTISCPTCKVSVAL